MTVRPRSPLTVTAALTLVVALALLGIATWRQPHFWVSADQRGERLMTAGSYREAAEAYQDPWRMAVARYRNGDFETAAHLFARVPGAAGAFDQGNAWLMHGRYAAAIESYDRALGFRPGWQAAVDNRALAQARRQRIEDAGRNRDEESAQAYDPDQVVTDQNPQDQSAADPQDLNAGDLSDADLRATWLRRVQTTPGDFLQARFAYQAAHEAASAERPADTGGSPP